MSGLIVRTKRAIRSAIAAFAGSQGLEDYAASTVRPAELGEWYGRRQQYNFIDLTQMFVGIVKVCVGRNAAGIASNPLCVYDSKQTSAFERKRLSRSKTARIMRGAGLHARKAMGDADEAMKVVDEEHPLLKLLKNVNPYDNAYDHIERTVLGLGLTGNFYWKVARDASGMPVEWWPLLPQFVHVVADKQTVIGSYVYGRGTEIEQSFSPDDIIHFRYTNPKGDPYYGLGDLAACVSEARLSFEFVAMAQAMIDNGGNPGWLFYGPMTPEQRMQLEISMQTRTAGAKNAGRHAFVSVPDTVKVVRQEMSEKEIAFLQSAERVEAVVCMCNDIPHELIRPPEGGLRGASDAVRQWQTYGLQPRGRKIEDTLNAWLDRERARGVTAYEGLFFAFDAWVEEDEQARHPLVIDAYNAGLYRKNEARMKLGLDADPDPAANEYKAAPAAPIPGDGAGNDAGSTDGGFDAGKGAAPLRDRGATVVAAHPRPLGTGPIARIGAGAIAAAALLWQPHTAHCCEHHRKDAALVSALTANESQLEAALRAWFAGITPDVLAHVNENGLSVNLGNVAQVAAGFDAATTHVLEALYHAGLVQGVRDLQGRVDAQALQRALTEKASGYLRKFQGRAFDSVTQTLTDRVRGALADQIDQGATVSELKRTVQEVMTQAKETAAETIARTESARAYLSARERAWMDAGIGGRKEWVLSADPCPLCVALSREFNAAELAPGDTFLKIGQTIALGELGEFTASYADMNGAIGHPNCRCSIALKGIKPA